MNTTKEKSAKKAGGLEDQTLAVQASHEGGEHHAVCFLNLRVLIAPDGKHWFAQGLEIDYAVQGSSVEDVKEKFAQGLSATAHHHLRIFGDIERMLKVAPDEAWRDLYKLTKARRFRHSQITLHEIVRDVPGLPFENIEYVEPELTAA